METQCHIASLCALLVQESVEEQRQGIENLRDECLRGTSASRHSPYRAALAILVLLAQKILSLACS